MRVVSWPINSLTLPKRQMHRGFWKNSGLMENSMEAFQEALSCGSQMIELDVRISSDEEIVVIHDNDLKRLKNIDKRVYECKKEELTRLGFSSLEEVLMSSRVPRLINIEIKSSLKTSGLLALKTCQIVEKCKAQRRVLFSSFNPLVLRLCSIYMPRVPRALLVTNEDAPENYIFLKRMWLFDFSRSHMLNLDEKMINPKLMKKMHQLNIPVAAWTVNDLNREKELLDLGVVSIISDVIHQPVNC